MMEFLNMGGYAFHVWTSWGLSTLALGTLFVMRASRLKKARALAAEIGNDISDGTETGA